MAQLANQFAPTAEKGQLTLDHNFNVFNCVVSANQATALVPGQAVLIEDAAGAAIPVTDIAAITDAVFGFVTYNVRTDSYSAGDEVKIAKSGTVMRMEASAAIARGAEVMVVISGNKVATKTSTNTTIGRALDKAAADGDLIRVLITV